VLTDYTGDAFARAARGEKPARLTVVVERVVDGRPQEVTLAVMPQLARRPDEPSLLGIVPAVDLESPQVAGIIDTADGLQPGSIPPGARIINIGGSDVSSFFDIIAALRKSAGRQVDIRWQKGGDSGVVAFQVPSGDEGITFRSALVRTIPFDDLRRLYKADSPLQAIVMGWKRTELFIKQAVVTLGQLISGALSPRTLSGPLGIVTATYRIASEGHISFYFYWLGLLSATIAVMNLLPLPILDGGLIVLMLIEKIKGSPISQRTQAALNYAGLAIIVGLMVYVTFNDIDMFFR
jgi:regulator of sigma E protease